MRCRHCGARLTEVAGATGRYRWAAPIREGATGALGSGSECPANDRGHEPEDGS